VSVADSGNVYASTLSPDGQEFYFFKHVGTAELDYRIFRSVRSDTGWGPAAVLALGDDAHSNLYPSLSPDGRRLVFSSYRAAPGDTSRERNAHLWYAERSSAGAAWSTPRFIHASKYGYYHAGLKHAADGTLEYNRLTPDYRTSERLAIRWIDTGYSAPERVEDPVATYWRSRVPDTVHVWGAIRGPRGLALVQLSRIDRSTGRRSPAQYFVSWARGARGEEWTPLVPAGGGLAEGAPNFAWFSMDGCYVHYTRNYAGFVRVPIVGLRGN
jgi:WD40 repeat protein